MRFAAAIASADLRIVDVRLHGDRAGRRARGCRGRPGRRVRARSAAVISSRGSTFPGTAGLAANPVSVTVADAADRRPVEVAAPAAVTSRSTAAGSTTTSGSMEVPSSRLRTPWAARPSGSSPSRPTDQASSTSALDVGAPTECRVREADDAPVDRDDRRALARTRSSRSWRRAVAASRVRPETSTPSTDTPG